MLKGKAALVTGSTSGIGLGIAAALAREGAKVMLNGFGDPKEIEVLRGELEKSFGTTVAYHPADLSKPEQAAQLVEDTEGALGRLDILVNNAGIQHVSPVEAFPTEKWDLILAINLSASFHTIRAALPGMRARGWGRIVNIASTHGLVGSVEKSAYVAAKHGLIGLTKVVALETARSPITCNALCPGWVLTPLVQNQIDALAEREKIPVEEARQRLLGEKQPSLEFTTPDQIGGLAVFLCSDAAAQIRGASLTIDGGWTAQ
jgi:3-hydroxybutyrate dehydrogenase